MDYATEVPGDGSLTLDPARAPDDAEEPAPEESVQLYGERTSRALLRFIADASHQLKTPLAGLQSTSELALSSREPAIWRQALETVHDSAGRTSRLAGQMLSLTRLQHLGPGHERQPLALDRLMREVATDWADRQDSRDHDLGLVIDMPTPVWVEGERWALHELLNNLIDNACRYTPPGSEIVLARFAQLQKRRT